MPDVLVREGEKMAIWQVSIILVRKEKTKKYLDANLWIIPEEFMKFFPEEKSWSHSIRQYGDLDSTCIEIYAEDDELSLRIDLRNITKEQLEIINKFAVSNELKIKYKSEVIEPTLSNFINIIKESNAYQFMVNPKEYLKGCNTGDDSLCSQEKDS